MAMQNFFDLYPEFAEVDGRRNRKWVPVTTETLSNRHEVALPKEVIIGKTILDLGSCLGATGQWCLAHGATHYTGVEVQPAMVNTSRELLSKHWDHTKFTIIEQDVEQFLNSVTVKYDVVVMFGVIYAFIDTYGILKKVTSICNDTVLIDSHYPFIKNESNVPLLMLNKKQHINSSEDGMAYTGLGCVPNPRALNIIMASLGFVNSEDKLLPKTLEDKNTHDTYSTLLKIHDFKYPARYMMRFRNAGKPLLKPVSAAVANDDVSTKKPFHSAPKITVNADQWVFDKSVAERFQREATTHIPDYKRVIDMCLKYVDKLYDKDASIIDVGSALGHTMHKFISSGYTNVHGVDNSQAMIDASRYPELVVNSEQFPEGTWDVVLANWTLHFMPDPADYLQQIYDNMNYNGMLILSNKMSYSTVTEEMYFDFKRGNGISEEEILKKKQALVGVMLPKSLTWYMRTLEEIGFDNIEVINANMMFNTICARKI